MPQISSNFILRSKLSNFERDSFVSLEEMANVPSSWIDEGHISYCRSEKNHYIFHSRDEEGRTLTGINRWIRLVPEQLTAENAQELINIYSIYVTNNLADLRDSDLDLGSNLSLGRIVFVKENRKLYYNTYDNTLGSETPQPSIHLSDSTGWFYPLFDDSTYVTPDSLEEVLDNYVTNEELENALSSIPAGGLTEEEIKGIVDEKLNPHLEEIDGIKDTMATTTVAVGALANDLREYQNTVESTYATKSDVSSTYATKVSVQDTTSTIVQRIQAVEATVGENNSTLNNFRDEVSSTYATIESLNNVENELIENITETRNELNAYKEEVEETYAKPDQISSLLNTYSPNVENHNKWVSSDLAGDLAGKTGEQIALEGYSYNEVFDQMLFNDFTPSISEPSVTMKLKESWMDKVSINWYNEKERIILVRAGTIGPDGSDIIEDKVIDAMISYPKGLSLERKYTNGLIPPTDEQQTSVGFCRIKDENNEWIYYGREGNRYHVPSILEPGSYRYYLAAFFRTGYPAVNNINEEISRWAESTPVESQDYVTINASKPIYYNTPNGMVEKPLKVWDDEFMFDTAELLPSCVLEQSFMVPRKLKALYIWNDFLGGYGQVPMVKELDKEGLETENLVPAYFNETIDENGYYTYKYDSVINGHRGAIKIKVEF